MPSLSSVYLFCETSNGLGDLFFILKTAKILRKNYPQIKITLFLDKLEIPNLERLAAQEIKDSRIMIMHTYALLDIPKDSEGKLNVDLVIDAPCPLRFELFRTYFHHATPVILISEYNDRARPDIESQIEIINQSMLEDKMKPFEQLQGLRGGIGKNKDKTMDGIYIHPELAYFASLSDTEKQDERIATITKLQLSLKTVLQGTKNVADYLSSTEVSIAYHPTWKPKYDMSVFLLASANKDSRKDIDLIVGGSKNLIREQITSQLQTLKANGYSIVEWINLNDPIENKFLRVSLVDKGKIFRVIYSNNIPHQDFVNLIKLSSIVGVTGDQSLSEALSCDVIPIYSTMSHKEALFSELYQQYVLLGFPEVAEIYALLSITDLSYINSPSPGLEKITTMMCDNIEKIKEFASQLSYYKERFKLANQTIREHWSLNKALIHACDQLISKSDLTPHIPNKNSFFAPPDQQFVFIKEDTEQKNKI